MLGPRPPSETNVRSENARVKNDRTTTDREHDDRAVFRFGPGRNGYGTVYAARDNNNRVDGRACAYTR